MLNDFRLIHEVTDRFGSQSVVVSLDIKKGLLGQYRMVASASGKALETPWKMFRDGAIAAGAGEIMVTAVDRDGTLSGMDTVLISEAAEGCPVPLISAGGAATLSDLRAAVDAGASAVAAGAMFVFHGPHKAVLITYPNYNELELLLDK